MSKKRNTLKTFIDLLASRLSLLILSAITVWLGISAGKEMYRKHEARMEVERLKAEIIALERKNSNLASLIDSFEDPEVIELEAKKRLNLKKAGEEVAVILRDKNEEAKNTKNIAALSESLDKESSISTEDDQRGVANPMKWWHYIVD